MLWRDGTRRPVHTSVALAARNAMIGSSRQPFASGSRSAMRATSALNSVTYIERSAASWKNPATGASGTVTLKAGHKGPSGGDCRTGTRSYRNGGASRSGHVLVCSEGGRWYEIG